MPIYTIESPDGRRIKVEAADRATAMQGAQEYARVNPKKAGFIEGAKRAVGQGFSFGLADEAAANEAALKAFTPKWLGGGGASKEDARRIQAETLARERAIGSQFAKDRPVSSAALNIVGGAANPLNMIGGAYAAGAKTLASAIGRNALIGGLSGGAYGGGSAEEGGRIAGSATGGALGGIVGGAMPVLARGAQATGAAIDDLTGGAIGRAVGVGANRLRAAGVPLASPSSRAEREGVRYVQSVAKRTGTTPQALRDFEAASFGKPVVAAEGMGRRGVVSAGALARRPGETGDAAAAMVEARQMQRGSHLLSDFEAATGISPEAAMGDVQAVAKKGRDFAAPLYKAAEAKGVVSSPILDSLMRDPFVKRASGSAMEELQSAVINGDISPELATPRTVAYWDAIKQALDDMVESAKRSGNNNEARIYRNLTKKITSEIDAVVPEYAAARKAGGDPIRVEQAFKMGQSFLSGRGKFSDSRAWEGLVKDASDPEREALLGGVADSLFQAAQSGRLKPNTLKAPVFRRKLAAAFQDEAKLDQFLKRLDAEIRMAVNEQSLNPSAGSRTAEWVAQFGEAPPINRSVFNPMTYIERGAGAIGSRMRTGYLSEGGRDAAGRMLYGTPNALADILEQQQVPTKRLGGFIPLPTMGRVSTTNALAAPIYGQSVQPQR